MKKKPKETADQRLDSKKLFDFANGHILKTVISEYDTSKVFGLVEVNRHSETLDLNSNRAVQWLSHSYQHVDSNVIHAQDFFKNVLHALISSSQMNGTLKQKVHIRIAQTENEIFYDLGTSDYKAIKISKRGIKFVRMNDDTPLFVRTSSISEQVNPKYDNEKGLEEFASLLLIKDNDKIVFKSHMVALFLELYSIPMPIAVGVAGSSKSTFTAYIKQVVDPSGKSRHNNYSGFPKKPDDLVAIESNRYMLSFDNVSNIDNDMSDELCRSITGTSSASRKYYTNLDESISSYKNKIVLNGIVPKLSYPDLQTRIISYPRKPLDKTNILTEAELEKRFHSLLPYVLGHIFVTLKKALKLYPKIKNEIIPTQRMADFEVWSEIIAQCLGYQKGEFQKAYDRKLKEDVLDEKESHVIVDLIVTIMEGKQTYEVQAQNLFNEIKAHAEDQGIPIESRYVYFPKIPSQLTKELTVIDPILKKLGFLVESYSYTKNDGKFKKHAKIIKISRRNFQETLEYRKTSSPSSPAHRSKKQTRNSKKNGEDGKKHPHRTTPHPHQTGEDGEDTKKDPHRKNEENRHESKTGEDGEDGEDNSYKVRRLSKEKSYWLCITHDTGVFHKSEKTKSSGNILKVHQKINCKIKHLSDKEAKIERDHQTKGYLKFPH